ncbi:MAG: radical SAM protein [Ruminococcus flavefaciens]|nr:radical SAM protein [Ruminococcus flavefaciens]
MKPLLQKLQYEVHLVDHCNLNCQMCDHFSPLAKKNFLSPQEYEKDVIRLAEIFENQAKYIRLLGGEPLLHPDIIKFFQISRLHFPDTSLELYTNGLLLPTQNSDFWNACQKFSVIIYVTKYPIDFEYSKSDLLAQYYNVKLIYVNQRDEVIKTSWCLPLDITGKQDSVESFSKCDMGNVCIFLKNGCLYPCTVAPNIIHFNQYFNKNLQITARDCINIYHADANDILKFLACPIPFCKYCDIKRRKEDIPWSISQKNITEWT